MRAPGRSASRAASRREPRPPRRWPRPEATDSTPAPGAARPNAPGKTRPRCPLPARAGTAPG
ncbi:MAG: hypothetical protein AMK73_06710 [Planctomycetes bacterium SM23_32]|nr:MAG: hypothetical protein AMK73_06710 [Planctomycetes bacterium SM23_32]